MKFRVGFGFDVHPLEEGMDLFLGGVKIPALKGAIGHSDADVLIHAICDALLGAANLRDIGFHYSDRDPRWKGMKSVFFLKDVMKMLVERGWAIENIDCTVCLENPKINPFVNEMKEVLAPVLNIVQDGISIKATTAEKLGYVGREEGISAYAVVLISRET
jgi:2-C-methyl-D-erythritol 2,4-cyclodiphosphate synthase